MSGHLNERVQIFDPMGNYLELLPIKTKNPLGIASTKNRIYITDWCNSKIHIYDQEGDLLKIFGDWGDLDGQFKHPHSIAIQDDEIYISDFHNDRVQVFDLEGQFRRQFGNFNSPAGIVAQNNKIYIADYMNHRVQIFEKSLCEEQV